MGSEGLGEAGEGTEGSEEERRKVVEEEEEERRKRRRRKRCGEREGERGG